jgi:hypothetical protein
LCAGPRHGVDHKVGSLDGDAQAHEVPIGHDDMAGVLRRMADRQDFEALAEQRMRGIDYLDLVRSRLRWVLEGGIMIPSRSTLWIMPTCGNCSGKGYVTG